MSPSARTLMVQGTASGVGKSWLVTALCRILRRRGYRVAPFKAQNMSNNAAVTASGGEVGRAQALQAEAAGVDIDERMNPVLLKPIADDRSEVVVMGRSRPDLAALPWLERRSALWPEVTRALDSLREDYDWIVIEGAGSPAEVNLQRADIVNMAVARYADAPVLLVADIDRGGAFASLVGTWQLLPPEDRTRLCGFILNRFRGDPTLLGEAPATVHAFTGVNVLGVVPWVQARLPEEDAATLERRATERPEAPVAVIHLPRVANFDDVLPLEGDEGPGVRWVEQPEQLEGADAVIIPGTRNVVADLEWLHATGLADALRLHAADGRSVLGFCGGFQMLGHTVNDPAALEGGGTCEGLGLLPLQTTLVPEKVVRRVRAHWTPPEGRIPSTGGDRTLYGYEIHHGRTTLTADGPELLLTDATEPDRVLGYRADRVWGTYVHGCLRDPAFRAAWLADAGIRPGARHAATPFVERLEPADPIDIVADAVDRALDIDLILAEVRETRTEPTRGGFG